MLLLIVANELTGYTLNTADLEIEEQGVRNWN